MFIRSAACLFALMITATASLAQERQWTMDVTETDAFMVFGVPETDDVGVSFWCTLGTPKIKIFVPEGGSDLKPFQTIKFNFAPTVKPHPTRNPAGSASKANCKPMIHFLWPWQSRIVSALPPETTKQLIPSTALKWKPSLGFARQNNT
jgi:hypothetical protein